VIVMATNTAQLRDSVTALAALQFDQAQIVDGRVTNPVAAAVLLQAVEAHVRFLVSVSPEPRPKPIPAGVDTDRMSDAALYAYYKRTAPAEDLRFFLRARMSDALRRRAEAVTKPTAGDLAVLRTAWRTERQAEEWAAGIPAIGTAEWHQQFVSTPIDADLPNVDAESTDSQQPVEALS
jgi:hypothetical protein